MLKTHVPGLDALLDGGIPLNNQVLVLGKPGSGKTLLALDILYHNAEAGIPCTYVSLSENPKNVVQEFQKAFPGLAGIDALIKKKMITILDKRINVPIRAEEAFDAFIANINETVASTKSKIVVIDALTVLLPLTSDWNEYERYIETLSYNFSSLNVMGIYLSISTKSVFDEPVPVRMLETFDGMISLEKSETSKKVEYFINVIKMRRTNYSGMRKVLAIHPKGFEIRS